jgi:hypothetical protein
LAPDAIPRGVFSADHDVLAEALQGVEFATLSTADPQCSDLLKDTEHIEQTVFFGNLALNNPVKRRAHADNGLPGRGDPKKWPIVRTPKSESSGDSIALGHHIFQNPLKVRKTSAHRADDLEITRRTT